MGITPLVNMGERSTLFCFAFLYIATRGAGIWSADHALRGAKGRSPARV
jgi:putative oxidoreductase